ncbi:hypothetical protein EVAR_12970_1 [Eumeta japonica]|uniref:Uncharacterized protein n=1 Tax=Eumeta variegata TaxID=151549 RepID=A0A4C1TWV3_EUMVA|nr:hypothetical protein EVAR_12970_1 [Eumeta japonica]
MEMKRVSSKERTKSQEDSDTEIVKRKEKQQLLFEAALKQTKTLISPVKDTMPPFPPPEDKILVKTEGDKIIIETKITSKAEDHVFIAKSPKKLDNKLGTKISRSFEDQKAINKNNNKINKSLEDKSSQSMEDTYNDTESLQKSPKTLSKKQEIKQQIEGKVVYQKGNSGIKSKSLDKKGDAHGDFQAKSKSLDKNYVTPIDISQNTNDKCAKQEIVKVEVHSSEKSDTMFDTTTQVAKDKTDDDSSLEWMTSSQQTVVENDTQTVIMERRKIDIINKQKQVSEQQKTIKSRSTQIISEVHEHKPEVSRLTSEEESLTEVSEMKACDESNLLNAFPYIDADSSSDNQENPESEVNIQARSKIIRAVSDDTTSTVDYEDYIGDFDANSSDSNKRNKGRKNIDAQNTFEESSASLVEFLKQESISQQFSETDTERDFKINREISKSNMNDLNLKWKNKIIVTPPQENSPTIENIPFIDSSTSKSNKSEPEQSGSSGSLNNDVSPSDLKLTDPKSLLATKSRRNELLKLNAERSRSSESTSWTSIEKDVSPSSANIKGSSIDDESSVSCSIARPLGISQDIEKLNKKDRECLEELKHAMEYGEDNLVSHHTLSSEQSKSNSKSPSPVPESGHIESPLSPRSPSKYVSIRESPTPTLEKQGQVDSQKAPTDSDSSSESIDKTVEPLLKTNIRKPGLEMIGKCVVEESESSQSATVSKTDMKKEIPVKTQKKTKISITISQEDNTTINYDDDGNALTSSTERELMKKRALRDSDQKSSSKSSVDTTTTTTPSKGSLSVDDSSSKRKGRLLDDQKSSSKSSMDSRGSLSVESRGSFETTESTSGSLGEAYRKGEELKPTWRPFFGASGSEGSSSIEEAWIPQDHEGYENLAMSRDAFEYNNQRLIEDFHTFSKHPPLSANTSKDSTEADFTDDLNDFPVNFIYPQTTQSSSDLVIGYGQNFGRTLSRISERSTNSEKTSADEDSTKACSRSESINEESMNSSDHQASLSSDPPSNANVAYISDTDRRTSAEMPDIPIDQTKISEMYADTKKDVDKVNKTIDIPLETKTSKDNAKPLSKTLVRSPSKHSSPSESQESEDWPLPELPPQVGVVDIEHPNVTKRKSSDQWPSPPSSLLETPIVEKVHIYYMSNEPERAMTVTIPDSHPKGNAQDSDDDSDTLNNDDYLDKEDMQLKSDPGDQIMNSEEIAAKTTKIIPYDESSYMVEPLDKHDKAFCLKQNVVPNYDKSCLSGTISKAACLNLDIGSCCTRHENKLSFNMKSSMEDKVIINQPTKSPTNHSPILDDDHLFTDDVFGTDSKSLSPDFDKGFSRGKYSYGSNNSDTSIDDLLSQTNVDDTIRAAKLSSGSTGTCKRCSYSSHSEEETSSFGTDLDGTVKIGLPPKKCTHSSHSEDTSICLSISEWSTGTNTVRQYANLSASESVSAVSIPKSEKSGSLMKPSEFSSSHGNVHKKSEQKLKASSQADPSSSSSFDKNSDKIKYDKLCSSETTISRKGVDSSSGTKSDSTLTLAQSISDWSASTSHTLVATAREDQVDDKCYDNAEQATTVEIKVDSENISQNADIHSTGLDIREPVLRLSAYATKIDKDKSSSISFSDKSDKSSSSSLSSLQKHGEGLLAFDQRFCKFSTPQDATHERYQKIPPKSYSYEEQGLRFPVKQTTRCLSEDSDYSKRFLVEPQNEIDIDIPSQLYSQEEKHSERYQSQDFSNFREDISNQYIRSDYKPLAKHASYDDKTLSKTQIKEYKSSHQYRNKPKSWSFHEHYLNSSDLPLVTVPELPSGHRDFQEKKVPERSSKTPLSRCSPYYSSSLSSESPPIQPLKVPVKKSILTRNVSMKSPPSGNDTDSSLDVIRDSRERMKTFRRKKQVTGTRKRQEKIHDVLEEDTTKSQCSSESDKLQGAKFLSVDDSIRRMESSECSDSYLPEIESGSSEMSKGDSKHYDNQEPVSYSEDDDHGDYANYKNDTYEGQQFPISITPAQFQGFGSSADEDEMGFPRFDRLGRLRHPYLDSQEPLYVSEDSPPRAGSYSSKSSRQSSLKKSKSGTSCRQGENVEKPIADTPVTCFREVTLWHIQIQNYLKGKDEYEQYRGSPYPERYEIESGIFQTEDCYPQYEQDTTGDDNGSGKEGNDSLQEIQYTRNLDERFSLNNVERFYSSHYVDSQASSDSPEQKFDVSTLPPPLCSDDENDVNE